MTNLQELRALIIKETRPVDSFYVGPVDLAMVLMTTTGFGVDVCKECPNELWIYTEPYHDWLRWDLTKDLDSQTPETILNLLTLIKGET